MFDVAIENAAEEPPNATIKMQQELFTKCGQPCGPGLPAAPTAFAEPLAFQKRWMEFVGGQLKKQRESLESQFSEGLKSIEEGFRLGEGEGPRGTALSRTVELWRKAFDFQRQVCPKPSCANFQAAVAKWERAGGEGRRLIPHPPYHPPTPWEG